MPFAARPFRRRRPLALAVIGAALLAFALGRPGGFGPGGPGVSVTNGAGSSASIAVVGDFGMNNTPEAQVASLIAGWAPDAVLGLGDDYYASVGGTGMDRYDLAVGKYYCAFLKGAYAGANCPSGGTADRNRFWSSTGNHDYSDGGGATPLANYLGYFPFPGNERYFSVVEGPVEVFVIDSDEALRNATDMAAQRTWLEAAARASR